MRYCQKCGKEMSDDAKSCEACGTPVAKKKTKKPIFKKWWFWVIIVIVVISIAGNSSDSETDTPVSNSSVVNTNNETSVANEEVAEPALVYVEVDLQTMIDELDANALKAEKTYQNKLVAVTGKIKNFDSDGDYITIEPVGADEWNFDTVMCNIKDDAQLNFLLEKVTGDTVSIKGEVTNIGELLGYTIRIDEVS